MNEMLERVAKVIAEATDNAPYDAYYINNIWNIIEGDNITEFNGDGLDAMDECERLNGLWVARKVLECMKEPPVNRGELYNEAWHKMIEVALNGS